VYVMSCTRHLQSDMTHKTLLSSNMRSSHQGHSQEFVLEGDKTGTGELIAIAIMC